MSPVAHAWNVCLWEMNPGATGRRGAKGMAGETIVQLRAVPRDATLGPVRDIAIRSLPGRSSHLSLEFHLVEGKPPALGPLAAR